MKQKFEFMTELNSLSNKVKIVMIHKTKEQGVMNGILIQEEITVQDNTIYIGECYAASEQEAHKTINKYSRLLLQD
jgi:hypothetical protein